MGDLHYREDFVGHQPEVAPVDENLRLPQSLELDRFDDDQLMFLSEWVRAWQVECFNRLLEFLSRKGCRYRICILDKMINRPDLKWRDAAAFYGVSQHNLYKVKHEIMGELQGMLCGLGFYVRKARGGRMRRFSPGPQKKKRSRKVAVKQCYFDFYEQGDK